MRLLKYQSLIALGISTVIFSGCASNGGGFLNLGVADALRKSRGSVFKKRLTYSTTPIGNTGLSLPTFGTKPALASGPVGNDRYAVQQSAPLMTQGTPAPHSTDCGCCCSEGTAVGNKQFCSPQQQYVVDQGLGNETIQQPPTEVVTAPREVVTAPREVVTPPVETVAVPPEVVTPPAETVAPKIDSAAEVQPVTNQLPKANPLPTSKGNSTIETNRDNNFDTFDTEGTLEPLGQIEEVKDDVYEFGNQEKTVEDQYGKDQSIFEEAELTKRSQIDFDTEESSPKTDRVDTEQKPKMLTLHARPAQSHNVYKQVANKEKAIETVQATHKSYYRQQNALRQQPAKLSEHGYRQARNTTEEIEFKPLPPVLETLPIEPLTPKTKLVPLKKSNINQDTQSDEIKNRSTRTAEATSIQSVKTTPRVPILRATTVSSTSILSLKNLANVIEDTQTQKSFYETNSHTAQGTTSSPVEQR